MVVLVGDELLGETSSTSYMGLTRPWMWKYTPLRTLLTISTVVMVQNLMTF
jgi:hypothetical protein